MKYTKATNYALHIIAFLTSREDNEAIGLQPLARHINMPPAYLSKILAQLVKANLIQSTSGLKGGYRLRAKKENITFFDVTQAIEGSGALFACDVADTDCKIQEVMREAENHLASYLRSKTIYEVVGNAASHDPNRKHYTQNTHDFEQKIAFLDGHMRKETLSPEEILDMLPLHKNHTVLDIGAGSGYLTIPAARKTQETVFALDADTRMLEIIKTKADAEKITNIQLTSGNVDDIPQPDASVDAVLASLILHEVNSLPAVLANIKRVLAADGRFLCLEYEKEEAFTDGPPLHIRIPSEEMERHLETAGFRITQKVFQEKSIYIMVAQKQKD